MFHSINKREDLEGLKKLVSVEAQVKIGIRETDWEE